MKTHVICAVVAAAGAMFHLVGGGQVSAADRAASDSSAWTRTTIRIDFLGSQQQQELQKFAGSPTAATLLQVAPAPWSSSQNGNNRECSAHHPGWGTPGPGTTCSTQAGSTESCSTNGTTPGGVPEGYGSACSAQGGPSGTYTCSSFSTPDSTSSHCSGTAGTDQCCSARGGPGTGAAQCSASSSGDTCSVSAPGGPGPGWGNACSSYAPIQGGTGECSAFSAGSKCSVLAGATSNAHCTSTGGSYPGGGGGWCSARNGGECSVFASAGGVTGPTGGLCSPTPTPTVSPTVVPTVQPTATPAPKPAVPSKTSVYIDLAQD